LEVVAVHEPETEWTPSHVFAVRLRETRLARGLTQAELADRVTTAGRPLSRVAILGIERGDRRVSLDEALALAQVLYVAPANLLSPPDGQFVRLTEKAAVDGSGMRNWLMFGDPTLHSPEGQRVRARLDLVFTVEMYAQAIIDAKRGGDTAGRQAAAQALKAAIEGHQAGMSDDGFQPPPAPARTYPACCPELLEERELEGNIVLFCPKHGRYWNPHYTERSSPGVAP
jgi:transcriptional regulator with XRE-family HTH domain